MYIHIYLYAYAYHMYRYGDWRGSEHGEVQAAAGGGSSSRRNRQPIGVGIQLRKKRGRLLIERVYPEGPSHRAGVPSGDYYLDYVDGIRVAGLTEEEVYDLVGSGVVGSSVSLGVVRGEGVEAAQARTFVVRREPEDDAVGAFTGEAHREVAVAMEGLAAITQRTAQGHVSGDTGLAEHVGFEVARVLARGRDRLAVVKVDMGGPAARAGLRVNDLVDLADGIRVGHVEPGSLLGVLDGPPGSTLSLGVEREGRAMVFLIRRGPRPALPPQRPPTRLESDGRAGGIPAGGDPNSSAGERLGPAATQTRKQNTPSHRANTQTQNSHLQAEMGRGPLTTDARAPDVRLETLTETASAKTEPPHKALPPTPRPMRAASGGSFTHQPLTGHLAQDRLAAENHQSSRAAAAGHGVGLQLLSRHGRVLVHRVRPYGPSARAGLRPGDQVEYVDGIHVFNLDATDVHEFLVGAAGTSVSLGIVRGGEERTVLVTREDESVSSWGASDGSQAAGSGLSQGARSALAAVDQQLGKMRQGVANTAGPDARSVEQGGGDREEEAERASPTRQSSAAQSSLEHKGGADRAGMRPLAQNLGVQEQRVGEGGHAEQRRSAARKIFEEADRDGNGV